MEQPKMNDAAPLNQPQPKTPFLPVTDESFTFSSKISVDPSLITRTFAKRKESLKTPASGSGSLFVQQSVAAYSEVSPVTSTEKAPRCLYFEESVSEAADAVVENVQQNHLINESSNSSITQVSVSDPTIGSTITEPEVAEMETEADEKNKSSPVKISAALQSLRARALNTRGKKPRTESDDVEEGEIEDTETNSGGVVGDVIGLSSGVDGSITTVGARADAEPFDPAALGAMLGLKVDKGMLDRASMLSSVLDQQGHRKRTGFLQTLSTRQSATGAAASPAFNAPFAFVGSPPAAVGSSMGISTGMYPFGAAGGASFQGMQGGPMMMMPMYSGQPSQMMMMGAQGMFDPNMAAAYQQQQNNQQQPGFGYWPPRQ